MSTSQTGLGLLALAIFALLLFGKPPRMAVKKPEYPPPLAVRLPPFPITSGLVMWLDVEDAVMRNADGTISTNATLVGAERGEVAGAISFNRMLSDDESSSLMRWLRGSGYYDAKRANEDTEKGKR